MSDIRGFKREHELAPAEAEGEDALGQEPDLRAEDDALVAAALEAEQEAEDEGDDGGAGDGDSDGAEEEDEERPRRRRRGRRGGRRRGKKRALEGTFDHGEEGYGLWLDPAVTDDPVYAEHWAGHRPVTVVVEAERIVITRSGEDGSESDDE